MSTLPGRVSRDGESDDSPVSLAVLAQTDPNEWGALLAANPTSLEEQDRFALALVRP